MKCSSINSELTTIYDVQIKRIHEYKRQSINMIGSKFYIIQFKFISILYRFNVIKIGNLNTIKNFHGRKFIFSGKAFVSYYQAKNLVYAIGVIVKVINDDFKYFGMIKLKILILIYVTY